MRTTLNFYLPNAKECKERLKALYPQDTARFNKMKAAQLKAVYINVTKRMLRKGA